MKGKEREGKETEGERERQGGEGKGWTPKQKSWLYGSACDACLSGGRQV